MSSDKIKSYCYDKKCLGPIVETGFHLEKWLICKVCKCEISERLKYEIEERIAIKSEPSKIEDDEDGGFPWI